MYLVVSLLILIGAWSVFVAGYALAASTEKKEKVIVISFRLIFGFSAICLGAYFLWRDGL